MHAKGPVACLWLLTDHGADLEHFVAMLEVSGLACLDSKPWGIETPRNRMGAEPRRHRR